MDDNVTIQVADRLVGRMAREEMSACLKELVGMFKGDYGKLFPLQFGTEYELLEACFVSDSLRAFRNCPGFSQLLGEFVNDREHAILVVFLATFVAGKMDALEFEPRTGKGECLGDLKGAVDGQDVLFECKFPRADLYEDCYLEQKEAFEHLCKNLECEGDVFVGYKGDVLKARIGELVALLNRKLPLVSGPGTLLHLEDITLDVTRAPRDAIDMGAVEIKLPPY